LGAFLLTGQRAIELEFEHTATHPDRQKDRETGEQFSRTEEEEVHKKPVSGGGFPES
jgi:hypothetical protein